MRNRNLAGQAVRVIAALLLSVSAVTAGSFLPVQAEAIDPILFSEVYFFHNASGGYAVDDVWAVAWDRWELHGKPAYCIEPSVFVTYDDVYSAEDFMSYEGLSYDQKMRLKDIAHFGFGPGRDSTLDYIATQLMIWIAVDSRLSESQVYMQEGDSHILTNGTDITAEVQARINEIEADISRYHTEPKLAIYNSTSGEYLDPDADVIEAYVNDELVITDQAGVLADYDIVENSCSGGSVSKDGNVLSVQFTEACEDQSVLLRHRASDVNANGAVYFYRGGSVQNLMSAGCASDGVEKRLNFKAIGVDLRINKASSEKMLALPDARLGLYEDENGNGIFDEGETLIEEFLSGTEEYVIHDLIPEHHYVLHEIEAPNGHVRTDDIAFYPRREDAENGLSCLMVDDAFQVIVRKNTQRNDRIADVELTIIDAESGKTARSENGEEAVYRTMADIDWDCSKYLREGHDYILRETELIGGVFKSADIRFTAPQAGDPVLYVSVTMIDQTYQVLVRKVDNTENASIVPNVTLTLYELDGEEEKELALHRTAEKEEYWNVTDLVRAGHSYRLRETETAPGYYLSDDIDFAIPEAEKLQEDDIVYEIVMTDEVHNVVYGKKNEDGSWIDGAVILVLDEEMEARMQEMTDEEKKDLKQGEDYLYRFRSEKEGVKQDENGEEIRLYSGRTYYLHEETAPFGYMPAKEDVPFTVSGTLEMEQEVYLVDERSPFRLEVYKYDAAQKGKALPGAEFTVYRKADDAKAVDVKGREAVQKTDEKGQCVFDLPYEEAGYYIRETGAPAGYLCSSERMDVVIEKDPDFDWSLPLIRKYYDHEVPNTAAKAPLMTALISVAALVLFVILQKKHD
ncbi:MAG: Cys-Gln thioester bond-forming surface protein [Solobacterium sp.]|nr:Cys-Gln thioester bond-forming surface protein [Solobacterium sp.]